jgi:hypothetical protein
MCPPLAAHAPVGPPPMGAIDSIKTAQSTVNLTIANLISQFSCYSILYLSWGGRHER